MADSSAIVNGLFNVATAATAGCMADFATFPLDTAKVRLQVSSSFYDKSSEAPHSV